MRVKSKALLLLLCAVLLIGTFGLGTMAYFTSQDKVVNTFSIGRVGITLDEALVTEDGIPAKMIVDAGGSNQNGNTTEKIMQKTTLPDADRVQENKYKLIPGSTYTKDPTVYIDANSSECWVFVRVENGIKNIEAPAVDDDNSTPNIDESYSTIITQMVGNGWSLVDGETNIYAYKEIVFGGTNHIVFEEFKVDGDSVVDGSGTDSNGVYYLGNYQEAKIVVTAYAIQADGFSTAKEAWAAYKGQFNIN